MENPKQQTREEAAKKLETMLEGLRELSNKAISDKEVKKYHEEQAMTQQPTPPNSPFEQEAEMPIEDEQIKKFMETAMDSRNKFTKKKNMTSIGPFLLNENQMFYVQVVGGVLCAFALYKVLVSPLWATKEVAQVITEI